MKSKLTLSIEEDVIQKAKENGYRILTERLWPRGVSRERVALDKWMKSISPSHDLRKWFDHDHEKWDEFKERYRKELFGSDAVNEMLDIIKEHDTVTMVYASKDEELNSTVLLKGFLEDLLSK